MHAYKQPAQMRIENIHSRINTRTSNIDAHMHICPFVNTYHKQKEVFNNRNMNAFMALYVLTCAIVHVYITHMHTYTGASIHKYMHA